MDVFPKIVHGFQPLTIFTKTFILDVWLGSECVSDTSNWACDIAHWLETTTPSKRVLQQVRQTNFSANTLSNDRLANIANEHRKVVLV